MSDATTSNPPDEPGRQDAELIDLDLVVSAAEDLRDIVRDDDRSRDDKLAAVDAMGHALVRVKASLS